MRTGLLASAPKTAVQIPKGPQAGQDDEQDAGCQPHSQACDINPSTPSFAVVDVILPKALRQSIILKIFPCLFPGTPLLPTLPFQVPRGEQLQVPVIGSRNPAMAAQEALGLWRVQEDFWASKT